MAAQAPWRGGGAAAQMCLGVEGGAQQQGRAQVLDSVTEMGTGLGASGRTRVGREPPVGDGHVQLKLGWPGPWVFI